VNSWHWASLKLKVQNLASDIYYLNSKIEHLISNIYNFALIVAQMAQSLLILTDKENHAINKEDPFNTNAATVGIHGSP
tara:strand:- start:53 stop:289 length:237 start_codon:yes stop_codon:yes gene_type:complete